MGGQVMAARNDALFPTPKLRAHRPRTSDALQQPSGDVQDETYTTEELPKRPGLLALYWKHLVAGMCLMLGFYLLMTQLVLPFVISTQEHWNYGYSRVSVYDLNVGHGGVSHFVAQYYKNQIVVIEMPIDHPEQSKIYAVSETVAGDTSQHVVTLTTAYVSRHAVQGKPDLIASVSGFAVPVVLYNTGDSFRTGE
jgi:hypothetical protein